MTPLTPDERHDCEQAAILLAGYSVALRAAVERGDRAELARLVERARQPLQVLAIAGGDPRSLSEQLDDLAERHGGTWRVEPEHNTVDYCATFTPREHSTRWRSYAVRGVSADDAKARLIATLRRFTRPDGVLE